MQNETARIGKEGHIPEGARVINSWHSLTKNAEGEAEIHTLHKFANPQVLPSDFEAPQAERVNIKTTRRKLAQHSFKSFAIFGDAQIGYRRVGDLLLPIHDEQAMAVARAIIKDEQPDEIVNLSDHVDFPTFSTFEPDSNHFDTTTQESINRGHSYWAELAADNPQAVLHEVDSNHTVRPMKMLGRKVMQFYGLRPAGTDPNGPMLFSYSHLLNHEALGVNFHSGRHATYMPKPDLQFRHGDELRSGGSTAEMLSKKYPDFNQVVGHGHRLEQHGRTRFDGKYFFTFQNGCLCLTTGEVPSHANSVDDRNNIVPRQENWDQSVMIIRDHNTASEAHGDYEVITVPIRNGVAYFNGKKYTAETNSVSDAQ